MAWQLLKIERVEKNDFGNSYIAWVSVKDDITDVCECLRLKFSSYPTDSIIIEQLTPVLTIKNIVPETQIKTPEVIVGSGPPNIPPVDGQCYLDDTNFNLWVCSGGTW